MTGQGDSQALKGEPGMKRFVTTLAGLLLASLACGSTGTDTIITGAGTPASSVVEAEPLPLGKLGERVQSGGMAVTLNSVELSSRIEDIWTPESGNIFVVVDVTVESVDRDDGPYNPLYFKAKDSEGFEYTASFAAPDPALSAGSLAPGDRARGFVAFEVKQGADGVVMSFEPIVIFGDYQTIRFALGNVPAP